MLSHWLLDPNGIYLNHGTVGAPPRRVLAMQQQLRDEIERHPARFLLRELTTPRNDGSGRQEGRLRCAAREVAAFFGARGEDVVFVDNATTAVNAILGSFELRAGDEILLLDHAYGAVRNAALYAARRTGATVRDAVLPFPEPTEAGAVEAIERAITPRTRLAIIDHITAASALVLPVAAMAKVLRKRGVPVLVDGAHAPGALALDIPSLGVDWYTGNLHKWAWAPRSCAILWVHPERQRELHPTTISWGLDKGLADEFDWVGTRDPTCYLAAPAALAMMQELGCEEVCRYNHELAWYAAKTLSARWSTPHSVPECMVGTMAAVRLPSRAGATEQEANRLRDALLFEDGIEVQISAAHGALWARASAQVYNEPADIDQLAQAVLARL